jgi:hypothetical protein
MLCLIGAENCAVKKLENRWKTNEKQDKIGKLINVTHRGVYKY